MTTARRSALTAALLALLVGALLLWPRGDTRPPGARASAIVLITPDTLRRDHVSAYAPPDAQPVHPHTPRMDKLADGAWRFEDARTPVPLTLPAHVTMLAGLPPARTGVRLNTYGRLPPRRVRGFPLLQERLQEHGWQTAAFVSAAVLGRRYGLTQGFDHYDDGELRNETSATVRERAGKDTVDALLAWLAGRDATAPLFVWVHLFEPHAPYERDKTYAGDVLALDEVIGHLLDGLRAAGLEDAAILLAADHGEAIGELGERTHAVLLADGVLRVPFLLKLPDEDPAIREDPVELADIAPTLAAVAGVPWETQQGPGCGIDLLAGRAPADRPRIAESLYTHHLFRWAQLVSAAGPQGTLVDAGLDRLHWVPPSGFQRVHAATRLVPTGPHVRHLAKAIAEYKQFEVQDLIRQGQAAGGYGGGGRVEPFLPEADNARLPDPHTSIPRKHLLDQIKALLLGPQGERASVLRTCVLRLESIATPLKDAGSPELHFWIGEAYRLLAKATGDVGYLARAERAYLRAFEFGRKDSETLARACGVNAGDREQAMLDQLETLAKQLDTLGCHYWMLKARLLRRLERFAEADAACKAGEAPCDNPRDRPLWERTCR